MKLPIEDRPQFIILPFLDILFSAIGIFLVILFLKQMLFTIWLQPPKPSLLQAHAMIICHNDHNYEWLSHDDAEQQQLIDIIHIKNNIQKLSLNYNETLYILGVFNADTIESFSQLRQLLEYDIQNTNSQGGGMPIKIMWWPIPQGDTSYHNMRQKWIDNNGSKPLNRN